MIPSDHLQSLEVRRLFVIPEFAGTDGDDVIQIGMTDTGYFIDINGNRSTRDIEESDLDRMFILECLAGNDRVTVDAKYKYKMTVKLGDGNDYFSGSGSSLARETIVGDAGKDTIFGNAGTDYITGGLGNDYLDGGPGYDQLIGDRGDDTYYSSTKLKKSLTIPGGNDAIIGGTGGDSINGGAGNDSITGGVGNDTICGNRGDDTISGGDGDDLLLISRAEPFLDLTYTRNDAGNDVFDGGPGIDQAWLVANTPISITLDGLASDGMASSPNDQFLRLENFHLYVPGTSLFDASASAVGIQVDVHDNNLSESINEPPVTIIGSDSADVINGPLTDAYLNTIPLNIEGRAGNDTIAGALGNDRILGGVGNDVIRGYLGNDHIEGNAGHDLVDGEGGKDTLFGNKGNDKLFGGNGNDFLYGGPDDADSIVGGAGTDQAANDDKDQFTAIEIRI